MAVTIELSNFTYCPRSQRFGGRALRFTLTILFPGPSKKQHGEYCTEACLAYIRKSGDLVWTPPISRWGGMATRQQHWVSPYLYHLVLDALNANTKLIEPIRSLWVEIQDKRLAEAAARLPRPPDKITMSL